MHTTKTLAAAGAMWLGALILTGEGFAQQSRYSGGWRDPSTTPASPAMTPANETVDRMVDELGKLIDEAERARAADPRFLADLRDLARRYAWPWKQRIAFDDFADGNVTAGPAWRIASGNFTVSADRGLQTRFVPATPQSAPANQPTDQGEQDVGKALLGALIKQMVKPRDEEASREAPVAAPAGPAEIGLPAAIPNAFAVQLTMTSASAGDGRLEFGVGQGNRGLGYRLAYGAGAIRTLELIRVGSRGSAIVDSVRLDSNLDDGAQHTVLLTRDPVGEFRVSVDGKELIRVADRGFRDPFDAFVLVNRGGDYTIRSVAVYGG